MSIDALLIVSFSLQGSRGSQGLLVHDNTDSLSQLSQLSQQQQQQQQ